MRPIHDVYAIQSFAVLLTLPRRLQSSHDFDASTFSLLDDSFGLLPPDHAPDRWSRFIGNITKLNEEADDLTTYKVSNPSLRSAPLA